MDKTVKYGRHALVSDEERIKRREKAPLLSAVKPMIGHFWQVMEQTAWGL